MDISSTEEEESEAQPVSSYNIVLKSLEIVKDYFLSYKGKKKS